MSCRRVPHLDLVALGLLFCGFAVALCVFSYDPADAPGERIYPPHAAPANLLGAPGAWLALLLHETLGLATYVLLASWFVLVVFLLMRCNWLTWLSRLTGWILLLPCVAVLGDRFVPQLGTGAVSGSGGTLGAALSAVLETHFDSLGRTLILAGWLIVSLLLTANFALYRLGRWSGQFALLLGRLLLFGQRLPWRRALEPGTAPAALSAANEPADPSIPIRHVAGADANGTAPALIPITRPTASAPAEERFADYELPPLSLLEDPQPFPYAEHDQHLREKAALLEKTFTDFDLNVRVVGINTGPVITQYEVALETGLRIHKVTRLADDLALNLKVPSVRMVAPIPGKSTVGVEIPNEHRATVQLKEVICTFGAKLAKTKLPLFLGKDTEGRPLVYDLAEMPHLLIAGRTGTGKSVCMNAIILSLLMTRRPDDVKMIMIDPKMLELSEYGKIPHLMHPVVKDMSKAEAILAWAVDKMEERYDLLSRVRVRGIAGYNELAPEEIQRRLGGDGPEAMPEEERARLPERMPYIVIFVDEMNDLMMTMKKEVEGHIIRLAQKSRAAGIHLVVATQKPTVDVITGLIKSNLPARICFQVSSRTDSRVVLDEMGAEKLLGKGDMLFLIPGTSTIVRAQGTYASDRDISQVVEHLKCDPCYAPELVQLSAGGGKDGDGSLLDRLRARDELYEQAIEVIVREGRGSLSLLQRALGVGYGRAARLVDFMAEDGIVGNYNGSQAREVLYSLEQWEEMKRSKSA